MKSEETTANEGNNPSDKITDALAIVLIEKHLDLWSERNSEFRKNELASVYSSLVTIHDPIAGLIRFEELNSFIDDLLRKFSNFKFSIMEPIDVHGEVARLSWAFGPEDNPEEVTGQDFFIFMDGKIISLSIFLD
ncbi:nuclear transport factor 2 family protein [Pedobacter jamesrossensis]|uniref:Nuclear transport factor 2 family protein n=1 Tax=Pedobacter jamesrossensis TaxID=1908238 RepID=A0ABV8NM08_9SPHI